MKYLFLFLINLYGASAFADKITASPGGVSIKSSVETSRSGDTIYIKPGIYKEGNVIIEKSLTIIGENFPVLDGELKFEIFTIHATNVTITGLKFINTGVASINDLAAIKVLDSKGIK